MSLRVETRIEGVGFLEMKNRQRSFRLLAKFVAEVEMKGRGLHNMPAARGLIPAEATARLAAKPYSRRRLLLLHRLS
jgi:hypothetical protein